MSTDSKIHLKNQLLAALTDEENERLAPHLKLVSLTAGEVLKDADEPARYVYFPLEAVISIITLMEDGTTIEVGIVGFEGLAGLSALLGGGTTPNQFIVQVEGTALRIKGVTLAEEFRRAGKLQDLVHKYIQLTITQISQSAACNHVHKIEERLCRWLLMMHDRAGSGFFPHTQEFLSHMLGASRPMVSLAASALQKAGLIRYSRGNITILDRTGLEEATCECYMRVKRESDRLRMELK